MKNRRISKQQQNRIDKKQESLRQKDIFNDDSLCQGLVIMRHSKHAYIENEKGATINCSIRPNIESIVAGDHVIWQEDGYQHGVVVSLEPRKSILGRPDDNGKIKPIAANVTQILIIVAVFPSISWSLLDSYLVMAEFLNIPPYIILNKTDLDCDDVKTELLKNYEPLGYPILFTNNKITDDKNLKKILHNQTSVLVGQSGVGKSSLIAKILPEEVNNIRTGDLSIATQTGCHTTSNSRLYHLKSGGAIIDSPGIRELSLWNMPNRDIASGYREFKPYISQCKYRNCSHRDTPGCAVINAVKNKIIDINRYQNYLKMLK